MTGRQKETPKTLPGSKRDLVLSPYPNEDAARVIKLGYNGPIGLRISVVGGGKSGCWLLGYDWAISYSRKSLDDSSNFRALGL